MDKQLEFDEQDYTFIETLGTIIDAEESKPHILNIPRMQQTKSAYQKLCLIAAPDWKISYSLHEPYTSMGAITIEASEFIFENMNSIQQVVHDASNVEIYPLVDGALRISITFHGVAKRIV